MPQSPEGVPDSEIFGRVLRTIYLLAALSLSVAEVGCEALSFDLALNLVCWQNMNDIFLLQIALLGAVASANASMMENAWKQLFWSHMFLVTPFARIP